MLLDPDARQALRCQACGKGTPGRETDVRGGGHLPERIAQVGWDAAEGHKGAMTMTLLHPELKL